MRQDNRHDSAVPWDSLGSLKGPGLDLSAWEKVFRTAQVPLFVQDISAVHAAIADIRRGGVAPIYGYTVSVPR